MSYFGFGFCFKGSLSHSGILFLLIISVVSTFNNIQATAVVHVKENGWVAMMMDVKRTSLVLNERRRRLGSFQICAMCTCCGGPKSICLPSTCCYAINCNVPNKPFGFCSFMPKSCSCLGCNLSN